MLTNEMYDAAGTVGTDPSAKSEQNASKKVEDVMFMFRISPFSDKIFMYATICGGVFL